MTTQHGPVPLFLCYAHEDEWLLHKLETHLNLLKRQELISTWYDQQIVPGADQAKTRDEHLKQAVIILLLVSPDFLASDSCYQIEMRHALERHEAGQAHVIPIALRPVDWEDVPFAHLQALPTNTQPVTVWENMDAAFVDVAKGIRKVIEMLPLHTPSGSPILLPSIWNIPYARNPIFTGREKLLAQLAEVLKTGETPAHVLPQAMSGLGGVGKTQLAIEYAYQHRQDYRVILWTRADTHEALISGYMEIAQLLNLPQKDEQEPTLVVKAVLHWLKTQTHWLLILDNADELSIVREFLPLTFSGHILLTTRAYSMGKLAKRIEVKTMDPDVGALLLLRRAGLVAQNAPLEAASPSDSDQANAITEELGGLPLALDQAGAYIEETSSSLLAYQTLYRTRKADLLRMRGALVDDHPEPVATTWSLSFQWVEEKNPAAAELLRFCAFLHPDSIPEEIILYGAASVNPVLASLAKDLLALDKAIALLSAYSLLHRDSTAKALHVHRLVQAVLQDTMNDQERRHWVERTVLAVKAALPHVEVTGVCRGQCEQSISDARVSTIWIGPKGLHMSDAAASLLPFVSW